MCVLYIVYIPLCTVYTTYRKLSTLVEYNNIVTFMNRITSHSYKLPFYCGGTGHVVYNSSFYCPAFKSDKIYRYDLRTNTYIYTKLKGQQK